jgi:ATP-dependent RNA helicase SUPV3L1/SUV3
VRQQIQSHGRERCCVIYGALPPDARQLQASLFNTPRTGYNVLSASDAVGMGLNLAIRRVVFTSLSKFDGTQERQLTTAEIKQVAGRAGRYGSRFPTGVVTAMNAEDLDILEDALQQPSDELQTAFVFPSLTQLEMLHSQHPREKLPGILRLFAAAAEGSLTHTHYSYAKHEEVVALAQMLRHLPLSLREAWTFAISPTDPDDVPVASALLTFATTYAAQRRVTPASILLPPLVEARSEMELQQLEASHRVLDVWLWLSFRFPDAWEGAEDVAERRAQLAQLIDASIRSMGLPREARRQVAAAAGMPTEEEIAALAAALEHQRRQDEWQQRRGSYRKRRR